MSINNHSMVTRSEKNKEQYGEESDIESDIDEYGNIKGLIDYDNDDDNDNIDNELFQNQLSRLRNKPVKNITKYKSKNKKQKNIVPNPISDIFVSYIFQNAIDNFNKKEINTKREKNKKNDSIDLIIKNIKKEKKTKEKKTKVIIEELDEDDIELDDEDEDEDEEEEEEDDIELDEDEDEDEDEEDEEDEGYEFDLDQLDETFLELIDNDTENEEIIYFHKLNTEQKENYISELKTMEEINEKDVPLKFKILNSEMDIRTKTLAINNINKLDDMDVSTGEYCKMDKWINGLISIPFGKTINLPINEKNDIHEKTEFILETQQILNKAIYGHDDAKSHILELIGKWIKNPQSHGNVLAIQGPMGNGKTTLVKEGISKAIKRPFAFIALGGASDSAFFDGHSYTYEGSHWGRIIDILIESKCMNPVIYFDELDKVSETHKGEEIINLLTHLTDPSQNSLFQDNYFPGIHLDLSKCLFIFSFNDESKVNRILKDRMHVINTKGFQLKDKIEIANHYLLPELLNIYLYSKNEIIFTNENLEYIITDYTNKEEGVRNLKRCLENILSKINLYHLSNVPGKEDKEDNNKIKFNFEIKNFKIPFEITNDFIKDILNTKKEPGPPEHMYM